MLAMIPTKHMPQRRWWDANRSYAIGMAENVLHSWWSQWVELQQCGAKARGTISKARAIVNVKVSNN
jgi:hypothetical protein